MLIVGGMGSVSGVIYGVIAIKLLQQFAIKIGPSLAEVINPQAAVGLSLILPEYRHHPVPHLRSTWDQPYLGADEELLPIVALLIVRRGEDTDLAPRERVTEVGVRSRGVFMKRSWLLLCVLIVALLTIPLIAACGGDDATTTTAGPATTAGGTETTAPPTTAGGTETTAPPTTVGAPVEMLVGGTFALTGAYAEDTAAVLAGFEDYVKYVNDKKIIAPWHADRTIPANITFKLVWGDDALAAGEGPHHL